MATGAITVAGASRPYPGERANGDAWAVDWHAGACRIAVIDGVGHGSEAAAAARLAVDALAAQTHLLPPEALRLCHDALRGSRGATISIAHVAPAQGRLLYAGVGNVEARLRLGGSWHRLITYRGIVGVTLRTIRAFELALAPDWLLLLHTDGVSARLDPGALPADTRVAPAALAEAILQRWGRASDDATVVVAAPDGDCAGHPAAP
ncbi:MAG TPA: SpoIIE family protein phosphatase [Chloroflexota bacterium]|nr:SpoIIE family protein phosphatase [Chloroflexota bacterium]